jgi:hypothetical protein
MAIELIAKIAPKGDAFTGMVDADQVIGGGAAGTLPDACVAASNITQHLLDEDDFASDSATKAPTQQSTKAYVLAHAGGGAATFQHRWVANGPYIVGTDVDGAYISDAAFSITGVWLYRGTAGNASSTIVDIHKNATTMYTTQGNRPTIAYNDADKKVDCTLPDVVTIAAGDIITLDIDQKETGTPKDLIVVIQGA